MNFAEFKQQINASLFFVSVPEDWNEEVNALYTIYKTSDFTLEEFIEVYFNSLTIEEHGYCLKRNI